MVCLYVRAKYLGLKAVLNVSICALKFYYYVSYYLLRIACFVFYI